MLLEPQALLSGVKNGNRLMFTLCYDRYHRGIYLFVLKYVRCEALAVGELPARQRTIFNLKIYESRSNQEIADMLNVSVNTVKVHYARTMKHLCQRLKKN